MIQSLATVVLATTIQTTPIQSSGFDYAGCMINYRAIISQRSPGLPEKDIEGMAKATCDMNKTVYDNRHLIPVPKYVPNKQEAEIKT